MIKFNKVTRSGSGSCNYCENGTKAKYVNSLSGSPECNMVVRFCDDCLTLLQTAVKEHIKFNKQFEDIVQ